MVSITVNEILQAFSPAFKSIDLRIVTVKLEEHWTNVIASMFLSSKSQKEIKSEQQQIREKLPKTDNFSILLECYPFDLISDLFKQIEKGEIVINGKSIKIPPFDPSKLTIDTYLPSYLKEMKEWKLIGSRATAKIDGEVWRIMSDQDGPSRLVGYENVYELIKETLRIRELGPDISRILVIGIPMPARIVEISLDGKLVKIKTKNAFSSDDLQLNISLERVNRSNYFEPFWRKTHRVKKCRYPLKRGFCYVTNPIKLGNSKPHDRIEVELIHRRIPTLRMDEASLMVPLENAAEPFGKALSAFCSMDVFKERLLNPERFVEGRTKPNIIFENAIAWLLSLVGFSVLHLGRNFETLRIPETGYQVGSIDIVAYRENERLLLVDCDTSIPDEKKIRSMKTVKDHFSYIQDEHKQPDIMCAIFSPKDCTGILAHPDVKIIGRYQIERTFEEAMRGNTEQARSSLLW